MPFARPSLTDRTNQAIADIRAELPGADAQLRYSVLGVFARVMAGTGYEHDEYLDWISRMATPWTCEGEFLDGWAALRNVFRKVPTAAAGQAIFVGTNGTSLPGGTVLASGDGQQFTVTGGGTITAGQVTVSVQANTLGAAGNLGTGTVLTVANAIAGVQSAGAVASPGLTGGADAETDDELRARMIAAWQEQPQGGAPADYVEWALAVPGITRAWAVPRGFGPGTVVLYVMLDDAQAARGGFPVGSNGVATLDPGPGIKATGDLLTVADALYSLQPATAQLWVCAPAQTVVPFVIGGIPTSSSTLRAAISAAITEVFTRVGVPGAVTPISEIESAIAAIPGTSGFVILSPSGNIANNPGGLHVLGAITYQ
jgi:uncharacterized phage protein gp47/JayE